MRTKVPSSEGRGISREGNNSAILQRKFAKRLECVQLAAAPERGALALRFWNGRLLARTRKRQQAARTPNASRNSMAWANSEQAIALVIVMIALFALSM